MQQQSKREQDEVPQESEIQFQGKSTDNFFAGCEIFQSTKG